LIALGIAIAFLVSSPSALASQRHGEAVALQRTATASPPAPAPAGTGAQPRPSLFSWAVTPTIAPSPADEDAIVAAIHSSPFLSQVSPADYTVVGVALARSDPSWGRAGIRPVTGGLDPADAVVHRTATGWTLAELGTYEVGCDLATAQVRTELGFQCPPPGAAG
jgi:hypothetical protein